ncbi:caspase family protein [Sinorhizobium sp. RAC02]|uniref:caspase family protein n=1 Tax=Sinorhizobium sp. RAC02 TaxID=1842534 RepID=UPI00083DB4DF|nr:caspase family protein [Sinorhizobium sp. RAC02]
MPLAAANGTGGTICNTTGSKYSCFAVRCSSEGNPEFAFFYNVGTYADTIRPTVVVDDRLTFSIALSRVAEGVMAGPIDAGRDTVLLEALKAGRTFAFDPGFRHVFSLTGSSAHIDLTLSQCNPAQTPSFVAEDTAEIQVSQALGGSRSGLQWFWDTDLPGHDYRGGLTDPALRGISRDQCATFCEVDDRCRAYTHNGSNNVCMLKEDATRHETFAGASSGIFHAKQPRAKARTDVVASFAQGLYWRAGDTPERYVERIRTNAAHSGGACESERTALRALAAGFNLEMPAKDATANTAVQIDWANKAPNAGITAYFIVSASGPVRFTGKGFLALTPDALGPYGIEPRHDESRAIVALHSRGAGPAGTISLLPLSAGPMDLHATLVGYIRACKEVAVLQEWEGVLAVKPAAPQIVLNDPVAGNLHDKRIDIPALGRNVLFNDTRFAVIDTSTGSEILDREGHDIALSPTKRFLAVRSNENFDVIDLVDGARVATLGGSDLAWFNNDSFVISEAEPWGRTWLASILSRGVAIEEQRTSCAACSSSVSASVTMDLENMLGIVAGPLGYAAFDLQDGDFVSQDSNLIIADEGLKGVREFIRVQAEAIGITAPIGLETGWNAPLGLAYTHYTGERSTGSEQLDAKNATLAALLLARDYVRPNRGLQETQAAIDQPQEETVLRGLAPVRLDRSAMGVVSRRTLLDALQPFGFTASKATLPDFTLEPLDDARRLDETARAPFEKRVKAASNQLSDDMAAMKAPLEWSHATESMDAIYCEQVSQGLESGKLPDAPDLAHRIRLGDQTIWIVRGICYGGPTAGSQLSKSYLAIFDEGSGTLGVKQALVAQQETFGAAQTRFFHEQKLDVKAIGTTALLFYAKAAGTIGLFDLKSRRFLFEKMDLPRGDMLKNAFADESGRYILQENIDGTFYIHRVSDAAVLLSGRFIDDEVVFWNEHFQFDATPEGSAFVNLRFPGASGQYSFQQFDRRLRVEGLMQAVLSGSGTVGAPTIGAPPSLEGTLDSDGARITGDVTAHGLLPVVAVNVYQDGVLTDRVAVSDVSKPVAIDVARLPSARWVSLVAEDADGLQSLPIGRDFGVQSQKPITSVLAVGIDLYEDTRISQLSFAKSDAERVIARFRSLSGQTIDAPEKDLVLLADRAAKKTAILAAAEKLAQGVDPGETAVFFFAGHGLQGADGKFYIATSATRADAVEATSLAWDELASVLSKTKGRLIVLLDACHSGAAGTGLFATNDDAVSGLQRSIPAGLVVFSASKGRELSRESAKANGGVFTTVLTNVMGEGRTKADLNGNGTLEVSELFRAVKVGVSQESGGLQTPWLARNQMIGEFSLF